MCRLRCGYYIRVGTQCREGICEVRGRQVNHNYIAFQLRPHRVGIGLQPGQEITGRARLHQIIGLLWTLDRQAL